MQVEFSENIQIVLVETTHPGNIGAAARAMKTMGLKNLVLVSPKIFPSAEITARATGADDILANIRLFNNLEDAVKNCHLVLGTSARSRNIPWPVTEPDEAAKKILNHSRNGSRIAILFGRESSGLSNQEIELCNAMIEIPANPQFSSLNIAAAVQVVSYEIRKTAMQDNLNTGSVEDEAPLATAEQLKQFYQQLEHCLEEINYYDPDKPRLLMRRLKRLFNRANLDLNEYNILRGILTAIQNSIAKKPEVRSQESEEK